MTSPRLPTITGTSPQPLEFAQWAGDVSLHFSEASSLGQKGRILFAAVRIMRPRRCLELGTAYGMSALFILAALKAFAEGGSLATVEGYEPSYALSSVMLKKNYGEMVSCTLGLTGAVLPDLLKSLGNIDFLFHDAGHSREDYIDDFTKWSTFSPRAPSFLLTTFVGQTLGSARQTPAPMRDASHLRSSSFRPPPRSTRRSACS